MPFRKIQLKTIVLALLFVTLFVAACSAPVTPAPTLQPTAVPAQPTAVPTQAPTSAPAQPTLAPTQAPPTPAFTPTASAVTVTDSAGRQVTFATIPTRIISLAPSTTEIVCAVGACDKLVGVDQFSDYPEQVKTLPKVSSGFNPNYEQIVAAKPDLVLAAGITSPDALQKLEDLKLPLLVVGAEKTTFDTIQSEIKMVGTALGNPDKANAVVEAMNAKLAAVAAKIAQAKTKPRVFWELDATDPAKPFTPGPGSFIDEIITRAGGENIAHNASSPYPQLNAEEIIKANPQIIILSDAAYGVAPDSVGKRPGWNVIEAVQKNQVYPIDDNLVSRPGPRVVDGLEAAAKLIHPELFTQ
jgi:iron complex transport system substrate-binding protein